MLIQFRNDAKCKKATDHKAYGDCIGEQVYLRAGAMKTIILQYRKYFKLCAYIG